MIAPNDGDALERYAQTRPQCVEYEEEYFTKTGYQGYADYPLNVERVRKIIEIGNPKSVLDVGGAYGFIVKRLLEKGIYAICMEVSKWAEAQKVIPNNFVRYDMRETPWPFKDKEFDIAYCEGVLEHIEDAYIPEIMKEFERVAHKRILALTFDWHVKLRPHLATNELAPGHVNIHNERWWFDIMPDHTWLFIPATGIQEGNMWLYKA